MSDPSLSQPPSPPLADPPAGGVAYAWISRMRQIMAFRHGGTLRVCSAICPHMGAQLQIDFRHEVVTCPWHGLTFRLPDLASDHPRFRKLKQYPATVRDGTFVLEETSQEAPCSRSK